MRIALVLFLAACTDGVGTSPKDTQDSGTTDSDSAGTDADGDGWDSTVDCDDQNADVHPEATEVCDQGGVDEDCDGLVNEADPSLSGALTFYTDADGDTYGDPDAPVQACQASAGLVEDDTDCDDANSGVNPGATEICDDGGVDEDCDNRANDQDPSVTGGTDVWGDVDGDGYGDPARADEACVVSPGQALNAEDCNDADSNVNPLATETCNGKDDDCDGLTDDDDTEATGKVDAWLDADGDGYGDDSTLTQRCDTTGYVLAGADCDDADPTRSPGLPELCDGFDDDCDDLVDTDDDSISDAWTTYADADSDGYGDDADVVIECTITDGRVTTGGDCNDVNPDQNPGETEVCDDSDLDEDCDGLADDADASVDTATEFAWYHDGDHDGYGAGAATWACDKPAGGNLDSSDCDDTNNEVNPGRTEVCSDGLDNDCSADFTECRRLGMYTLSTLVSSAKFLGGAAYDEIGTTGGSVGDMNGDGVPELWVGSPNIDAYFSDSGAAYVFFGGTTGSKSTLSADYSFGGLYADSEVGATLLTGDFDGDGVVDVLAGAPATPVGSDDDIGQVWLWTDPPAGANDATTSARVWTGTVEGDSLGKSLVAGDVTGDGAADVLMSQEVTGRVDIYEGPVLGATPLATLSVATTEPGTGPMALDDFDGDGVSDLLLGGRFDSHVGTYAGRAWVCLDPAASLDLDASADFIVDADAAGDWFGAAVTTGDFDGDGYADLAIGAPYVDTAGTDFGAVYVFSGPVSGATTAGTADAIITGAAVDSDYGAVLSTAGDFDGDGADDLVFAAPGTTGTKTQQGVTYVGYGPFVSGSVLDTWYMLLGESATDESGSFVTGVGDIDGDGADDILLGAPDDDDTARDAGAAYLMLGRTI